MDKENLAKYVCEKCGHIHAPHWKKCQELSEEDNEWMNSPGGSYINDPKNDPHSCKCRNDKEVAMTVKRLDEGLFQCPRCGGIIVFGSSGKRPLNKEDVRDVLHRVIKHCETMTKDYEAIQYAPVDTMTKAIYKEFSTSGKRLFNRDDVKKRLTETTPLMISEIEMVLNTLEEFSTAEVISKEDKNG